MKRLIIELFQMKKIFIAILLSFLFCNTILAETYYFKGCVISNAVLGNYTINLEKNVIEVELKTVDGQVQYFSDKIKKIEKNKIISEKIKSAKGEKIYYQYVLNKKSKSVIKLQYKKEGSADIDVFNLDEKRESFCNNIKADWDKKKLDEAKIQKEQDQILKAQEELKKEQTTLVDCQGKNYKQWTNCKGEYKSESGHKYEGLFKNGEIFKGISVYPGGAKYVGIFKNFQPDEYGTFVWPNGDKYVGEWKEGKSHGNGTKVWKNGSKYLGEFKNDKIHGRGTLFYPDGNKYEGQFINGKRHGEGIFTYKDGSVYIGKFAAGKEEGIGECISKDGESVKCMGKTDTQTQDFSGKDTRDISIVSKKWVRISQYEANSKKGKKIMDKLKADFETKALELCSPKSNYNVLEKKIEVLEIDETPAYGLEAKLKIGINGVVECK